MFCSVYSGVCETEPTFSKLAEHEAEDQRRTRVGWKNIGVLADSTAQSPGMYQV